MATDPNNIYDDVNSAFVYQPQSSWFAGTWNASSVGQSGTLHVTNDLTANVTFTFPVAAIGFSYFGIQRSRGGNYGVCIDCTPGAPNFIPVDAFNATDNGANPPVLLFQHNFTALGVHQIIIQNMADPRGTPAGNSQLTLDRIELTVPSNSQVTTVIVSGSPTTSPTTSTPAAGTTTTAPNGGTAGSSSSSPPIGAIVGGVLGALAVLIGGIILFYWLRLRRRRARDDEADGPVPPLAQYRPEPFGPASPLRSGGASGTTSPPPTAGGWGGYGAGLASPGTSGGKSAEAARNAHQRMMPSITSLATSSEQPPSTASGSGSGSGSGAGAGATLQRRREQDAGPLPVPVEDEDEEEEDTLPPEYGQVFAQRDARRSRRTTRRVDETPPAAGPSEKAAQAAQAGGGIGVANP